MWAGASGGSQPGAPPGSCSDSAGGGATPSAGRSGEHAHAGGLGLDRATREPPASAGGDGHAHEEVIAALVKEAPQGGPRLLRKALQARPRAQGRRGHSLHAEAERRGEARGAERRAQHHHGALGVNCVIGVITRDPVSEVLEGHGVDRELSVQFQPLTRDPRSPHPTMPVLAHEARFAVRATGTPTPSSCATRAGSRASSERSASVGSRGSPPTTRKSPSSSSRSC